MDDSKMGLSFIIFLVTEQSNHHTFKSKYTLRGWNMNKLYTVESQINAFNEKFIPFIDPETKLNKYFSRNHLTPHADFVSIKEQALTYYFHNCFPGANLRQFICKNYISFFVYNSNYFCQQECSQ